MIFTDTETLVQKTSQPQGSPTTIFIKEQLESIPLGQGLKMADLVNAIMAKFPVINSRNAYVKINHILKTESAKYQRYSLGKKRGSSVYIGKSTNDNIS